MKHNKIAVIGVLILTVLLSACGNAVLLEPQGNIIEITTQPVITEKIISTELYQATVTPSMIPIIIPSITSTVITSTPEPTSTPRPTSTPQLTSTPQPTMLPTLSPVPDIVPSAPGLSPTDIPIATPEVAIVDEPIQPTIPTEAQSDVSYLTKEAAAEGYVQFLLLDYINRKRLVESGVVSSLAGVDGFDLLDPSLKEMAEIIVDSSKIEEIRDNVDLVIEAFGEGAFDTATYKYNEGYGLENEWKYVLKDSRTQITKEEYEQLYFEYIEVYAREKGIDYEVMYRIAYANLNDLPTDEYLIGLDFIMTAPAGYTYISKYETFIAEIVFNDKEIDKWFDHSIAFLVSKIGDSWEVVSDMSLRLRLDEGETETGE